MVYNLRCPAHIRLGMMSTPNSVENVLGFLLIVVIFYLSIKTKCLTTIKFKRDEK